MKFERRNIVPPGGKYFYEVPETKMFFEHPQFSSLELLVREHYYNNNIPLPEMLSGLIEDYMCRHLPKSFCIGVSDGEFKRAKTLTYWVVADNTFRLLSHKEAYASAEEAEKRAAICMKCGNNLSGICSSCSGLKLRFAAQLRGLSTTQDRFLGVCAVDGSLLTAKVYAPLSVAERIMNRERTYEYEGIKENPDCWVPRPVAN